MGSFLRRVRGAFGMALTWAIGWFGVGVGIELIHNIWPNPFGAAVDIWPAVLAYPAFLGGLAFSVVLRVAGRRRRFDELSLPWFTGLGAVGGLLLGLALTALFAARASADDLAIFVGAATFVTASSAAATLALARLSEDQQLVEAGDEAAQVGLTEEESRRLLGG